MTSRLDGYLSRGAIDRRQYDAGIAFEADYRARYGSLARSNLEPKVRSGSRVDGFSMAGIGAKRAGDAIKHLGELRLIVLAVVVEGWGAGEWMASKGRRQEDGIAVLRHGLDVLADFYLVAYDG